MCACAHGLSLRLRDSSTCGAVPKRSEGMSREDGEAQRWRRSETKPTPEAPEIYSVLRCPAVLFLTIRHCSAKNRVLMSRGIRTMNEKHKEEGIFNTALPLLADCVNQRADIFSVAGRHGLKFIRHFADFRGIVFPIFGPGHSVHKIFDGDIQGGRKFYGYIGGRNRAVLLKIIAHRTGIKSGARGKFLYHQPLIRNLIPQIFLETHV